jgi:PAS domain-containing protein
MTEAEVDYGEVFLQLPIPVLLVTPELVIADANAAYLKVTGRSPEELVGRDAFEAFPDNPLDPGSTGVRDMRDSMLRVLATGESETMAFQRYDVEVHGRPGVFAQRYWCPVNAPVFGRDGRVMLIAQCVEEITDRVRRFVDGLSADGPG